jgi:hypothetical protein
MMVQNGPDQCQVGVRSIRYQCDNNLPGRQCVSATIGKHRPVQFDPLVISQLGAWVWLLVRDKKSEHSSIGSVADIAVATLAHLIVTLTGTRDFANE